MVRVSSEDDDDERDFCDFFSTKQKLGWNKISKKVLAKKIISWKSVRPKKFSAKQFLVTRF